MQYELELIDAFVDELEKLGRAGALAKYTAGLRGRQQMEYGKGLSRGRVRATRVKGERKQKAIGIAKRIHKQKLMAAKARPAAPPAPKKPAAAPKGKKVRLTAKARAKYERLLGRAPAKKPKAAPAPSAKKPMPRPKPQPVAAPPGVRMGPLREPSPRFRRQPKFQPAAFKASMGVPSRPKAPKVLPTHRKVRKIQKPAPAPAPKPVPAPVKKPAVKAAPRLARGPGAAAPSPHRRVQRRVVPPKPVAVPPAKKTVKAPAPTPTAAPPKIPSGLRVAPAAAVPGSLRVKTKRSGIGERGSATRVKGTQFPEIPGPPPTRFQRLKRKIGVATILYTPDELTLRKMAV